MIRVNRTEGGARLRILDIIILIRNFKEQMVLFRSLRNLGLVQMKLIFRPNVILLRVKRRLHKRVHPCKFPWCLITIIMMTALLFELAYLLYDLSLSETHLPRLKLVSRA